MPYAVHNIRQIFLDLDGPLLDGKERHYFCYRSILERFGFEPIGIDAYWKNKRARGNRRDLLKMSGAEEFYDEFLSAWVRLIESPEALILDKVQEGAADCLRSWKKQGIELIVATMRKNQQALEQQLVSLALRPLLDAVLVCNYADGGAGKAVAVRERYPDTGSMDKALWIGDTEADWEAAQSLGCNIVLVANGLRAEVYLKTLKGAVVLPSISSSIFPNE